MNELAEIINDSIKRSNVFKMYVTSKENLENNDKLNDLKNRMDSLKKENCRSKNQQLIDEFYELEQEYNNHVLVRMHKSCVSELYSLLGDISDILSFK